MPGPGGGELEEALRRRPDLVSMKKVGEGEAGWRREYAPPGIEGLEPMIGGQAR